MTETEENSAVIEKQPKEQSNMRFRARQKVIAIALSLFIIGSRAPFIQ